MSTQLRILGTIAFAAGVSLLSVAAHMVYPPAMYALLGLVCIAVACLSFRELKREEAKRA